MTPPYIANIDQHQSSHQKPITNSNMINSNPQNIMQHNMPPNVPQPRVHINVAPQPNENAQVVPTHVDNPNPNLNQQNIGAQSRDPTST